MGVVLMSKRELNRIDVLARLDGRRLTISAAAAIPKIKRGHLVFLLMERGRHWGRNTNRTRTRSVKPSA
jgi:hypothetical protein